jgi:hypothetical protein
MSSEAELFFEAEEERLLSLLQEHPVYRRLQAIRHARSVYHETAGAQRAQPRHMPSTQKARPGSQSAAVQDATEAYIGSIMRRARTSEIVQHLCATGIIGSTDDVMLRTVSSYLSSARDRFDNAKGADGGYGLKSWVAENVSSFTTEANGHDADESMFDGLARTTMDIPPPPGFLRSSNTITADSTKEPAA